MRTKSITFRLITFITIVFLVTMAVVMALVNSQMQAMVDKDQGVIYNGRIDAIINRLEDADSRLKKTGLVDTYINDFQDRAINDIKRSYFRGETSDIYPFILEGNGKVIMHPSLPKGELVGAESGLEKCLKGDRGEFVAMADGRNMWYVFKRFDGWNWTVAYVVPMKVKYQDLLAFRKAFAIVLVVIAVIAIAIMAVLLSSITKPIVKLTELTTEIAEGNLDITIEVKTEDEVGTLARRFNGMRDAIKARIDELSQEISERRKAEAAIAVFQSAVAASTDAIGMSTAEGVHFYQNKAFDQLFGEIGDDPPSTLYVDNQQGREVFQTIMNGDRWEGELQMNSADGKVLDILLRAYSVKDEDGAVTQLIGVHTDITEIKRASAALEKRIVALTQPLESVESIAFDDLFNRDDVQRLQDEFAEATGVASIITSSDGVPITKPSNFCRLCKDIVRKTEIGLKNCLKSDAALRRLNVDGPTISPCMSCGLWDAGAPITVGGKHIANWLIGQVRDEQQGDDAIRSYAEEIGADPDEATAAFYETPTMSKERFEHVAQALNTLANQFSSSAYQNVQQARFISERKTAEGELRRNEQNLRTTLNSIGDAVISTDRNGSISSMNPIAETLTGWTFDDAEGKPLEDILKITHPGSSGETEKPLLDVLSSGDVTTFDNPMLLRSKEGSDYRIAVTVAPIRDDSGAIRGAVMVFRDVTSELEMQEQLRHSQKMDAIGQLAGGVAHDFNNMLGGIMGSAELLKLKVDDEGMMSIVDMIIESADRAAALTQKLLTFARKQPTMFQPVNITQVVSDSVALLTRTIDKRIDVELSANQESCQVNGDSGLLQNAILNLGINASHAMPEGGTVFITTSLQELNDAFCTASHFDLTPGQYFALEIRDTGCGIPSDDLQKIYDPFYTTKGQGKGTGLGLAAVYGTVLQHRGAITVESSIGIGTSFKVYLPALEVGTDAGAVSETDRTEAIKGEGKILVVDDEDVMRKTAKAILTELGYDVALASDGKNAVEIFTEEPESFDVVLLDMIMPVMNGRDCFAELKKIRPEVHVILASGFADEKDLNAMKSLGLDGYISKPFSRKALSKAIHDAINKTA